MGEISLAHNEAENLLALRRLESRFSSRYREYPSDPRRHAMRHLWIPIPHSPIGRESIKTGTKADSPDGLYCSGGRTLPPYAQLMGNRSTGCEIAFQSHCHSPCAGLSPAFPI